MAEKEITITELRAYFDTAKLPKAPFQLNAWSVINDEKLYLQSHLAGLEGKELPLNNLDWPMYQRLVALKDYIEKLEAEA